MDKKLIRHFHLFCVLGGNAQGFKRGHARVGNTEAKFQCLGGIDVDPDAIADLSDSPASLAPCWICSAATNTPSFMGISHPVTGQNLPSRHTGCSGQPVTKLSFSAHPSNARVQQDQWQAIVWAKCYRAGCR
jgi:hypothetical protein